MSTALPDFPACEYYSCRDNEEILTHDSPEEAIVAHCDGLDLDDLAEGVDVYCFERQEIPKNFADVAARDFYEWINEHHLVEELHDPDGDYLPFDSDEAKALMPEVRELIQKLVSVAKVWACERCAKVEVSGEQLEAFLRKECPEWFEK